METPDPGHEETAEDVKREADERLDELAEDAEDMEERLEEAGSDAGDVDVPDPADASGPGIGASDLTADEDEESGEPDS